LKLVLGLYVYANSTQLSIVEILTTTLDYPNHAGANSKIMPPMFGPNKMNIVLHRVRCGG